MKSLKYHIGLLCTILLFSSCDDFLEEKPKDFYSPENSMTTVKHFQSSLNYLYNRARFVVFNSNPDVRYTLFYATDFAFYHQVDDKLNDYKNKMVPTFNVPNDIWNAYYTMISNANVIISRLDKADQINNEDKALIKSEALFFRAYAYRNLAHLFGGVPLILEEISTPQRDKVRSSRDEVYKQIKQDLEEAVQTLPNIESVKEGKVNKQVALHLLAEIDICLGLYDEAISATTDVISYPEVGLMTERFGSRMSEPGDVYWDLFRLDNQNRSSGNKEGLWVSQYDYLNAGSTSFSNLNWAVNPFYQNITVTDKDASGKDVTTNAFVGVTDGKCGRSVGWMHPTDHFFSEIWRENEDRDIRNSQYNIIRDVKIDNPKSPACGKWLVKDGYSKNLSMRQWYPIITKLSRINNFPEDFWKKDAKGNPIVTIFGEHVVINNANAAYKDEYFFRLAETYLLRAEAYVLKGEKAKAVSDINVIRSRAHAKPATAEEMNMDYILDERLRELYGEETRMITLCRMGKLVERNRKFNPRTGKSIEDYHNLWPIPFSEIERNTGAVLEQNPGY